MHWTFGGSETAQLAKRFSAFLCAFSNMAAQKHFRLKAHEERKRPVVCADTNKQLHLNKFICNRTILSLYRFAIEFEIESSTIV